MFSKRNALGDAPSVLIPALLRSVVNDFEFSSTWQESLPHMARKIDLVFLTWQEK